MQRRGLADAHKVVVKVGSRSLVGDGVTEEPLFAKVAKEIAALRAQGRTVVLVSSGAVALGKRRLGLAERPKVIPILQACAATGQSLLMQAYENAFKLHGIEIGQLLLTHANFAERERYLNARATLEALLDFGVLPIINENDTVAVDELSFGDNDHLAALVASLVGASALVLLTDVDGVRDTQGQRVPVITDIRDAHALVTPAGTGPQSDYGLGGMLSKLNAAGKASHRGVPVIIAPARRADVLQDVFAEIDTGTLILPRGAALPSRKHWIAYTLKPKGTLLLDAGAVAAVVQKQTSLLPIGIVGVQGQFEQGDLVVLADAESGGEVARGLARYSAEEVSKVARVHTRDIESLLGRAGDVVVHRDDLVVL